MKAEEFKVYWVERDGEIKRLCVHGRTPEDTAAQKERLGIPKGKHASTECPPKWAERYAKQLADGEACTCRAMEYPSAGDQLGGVYDTFSMQRMNAGKLKKRIDGTDGLDPDLKKILLGLVDIVGDLAPSADAALGQIQAVKRKHKKES